jgi:arginine-tRNA-protein transferase
LTRRFKKIWNSNQDLEVIERNDLICKESYALYEKYINTRHRDGDMYPASLEQFEAFIKTKTVDTRFYLFYQQEQLVAVSVTDILEQGLSAVYTFFDPTLKNRSLGYHVILWQVQQACSLQLPYLFLGYWIKNCPKMQYKSSFRPLELLVEGNWRLAR